MDASHEKKMKKQMFTKDIINYVIYNEIGNQNWTHIPTPTQCLGAFFPHLCSW